MRRQRRAAIAIGCLLLAIGASTASAAGAPAGSIAWWSFDPSRFRSAGAGAPDAPRADSGLMLAALRAGVSSGLFGDGAPASILEGLLAASEVGRHPHTLALIDFAAVRGPGGRGMDVRRFAAVLEVRTDSGHAELLRTVRAIAVDAPAGKAGAGRALGAQSAIDLPGGRRGVAYVEPGLPAWRRLAWTSLPGRFVVAIGPEGTLARWLDPGEAGAAPAWAPHEALVDGARPDGAAVLGAFVDLGALRARFPVAFASGRTPRMLRALDLHSARRVMAHARLVPSGPGEAPLLAADVTREDRSGAVARQALSTSAWPGDDAVGFGAPPGSFVLAARVEDWDALLDAGLEIYLATVNDEALAEQREGIASWRRRAGDDLDAVLGSLGPWLVLSDHPTPPIAAPGFCTVLAAGEPGLGAALGGLVATFPGPIEASGADGDPVWSLRIDSRGLVRLPAWGIGRARGVEALIGCWGEAGVVGARRWLGADGPARE